MIALASTRVTLLPLVITTVEKLLPASSSVMLLPAPAAKVAVPVTARVPVSVMAPVDVTSRVPLTVEAPRMIALASVIATLLPLVITTVE